MSRSPSSGLPSPTFPPPRLPPRSPARQLHQLAHLAHIPSSRHPSLQVSLRIASSLGQSAARHAVPEATLSEGDLIGEGLLLHGQPIRLVDMPSSPRDPSLAPAAELQVIRKLGTGSYAVVFLVREVIRSIPSMASQDDLPVGQFEMAGHAPATTTPFVRYGREFAVKCLSKASLTQEALEVQLLEVRASYLLVSPCY